MDSTAEIVQSEAKLGEKRVAENVAAEGGEAKRVKRVVGDVRKVAEMVLVLAAMGKMRGGRVPSQAEKEIMSTARDKLAEVCQWFAPKDVFPRDVFGGIIEDLGLSKVREQRLGFRPPRISIAEKLLLSKRKMENKSQDLPLSSAPNSSQRLQANSGVAVESRGPSHAVRVFPSDKPSHTPNSSGSFQPAAPLGHVAATNSTSLPYQLPTSEVRPVVSSGFPSNHLGRDSTSVAQPRIDRPHLSLDRRQNGSFHQSNVQANSSGDHSTGKTATWSVQPQSVSSAKIGSDTKMPTMIKAEAAADAKSGMPPQVSTSKPFVTQTMLVNPPSLHHHLQGTNPVQAPILRNTHAEIGKIVQKFLQPQASDRPVWMPSPTDDIIKALTCQVCKSIISEVDNVLVCDACEKGFHLKCLQINNPKGVPRAEWHCDKCLQISNGKPLPPKYGRVMRNIGAPKGSSNTSSLHSSLDKKAASLDEKVNQQKTTVNGNNALQNAPTGGAVGNSGHPSFASKLANPSEVRGNSIAGRGKIHDKASFGTSSNNIIETSSVATLPPSGSSVKGVGEEKLLVSKSQPPSKADTAKSFSGHSQSPAKLEDNHQSGLANNILPPKQSLDGHIKDRHLKDSCGGEGLCKNVAEESARDDRETVRANSAATSTTSDGHAELESVQDNIHRVDWRGDILRVDNEKIYYHSFCINGVVYKLQDHVLIRFTKDRLIPCKLQAMWEDRKMKTKWVTVNRCYFPGDLPEAVGRPCGLESSEVYESTYGCTVMAGLIQGPCAVLPPSKFTVEKERRTSLGMGPNDNSRPLYLCKWIYDESKGLFRDVSC